MIDRGINLRTGPGDSPVSENKINQEYYVAHTDKAVTVHIGISLLIRRRAGAEYVAQ